MRSFRPIRAAGSAATLTLLWSAPVSAHALHGDVDAPLPFAAYILGAAVAVALSFAFVAISDDRPAPEPPPGVLRTLPRAVRTLLRVVGLIAWSWVVVQAILGGDSDAEVASLLLWVFGWVGLAIVSGLLGPVWSWLDPFTTLYDIGAAVTRRLGWRMPGRAPWHRRTQAWPAVIFMLFFVWLELGVRIEAGRQLGFVLIGYTLLTLGGMAWYGRDRWRRSGEVFGVWFGLLGRLAPYGLEGRASEGRLRRRPMGSALTRERWTVSLLVVVALATGAVIWDGISQTQVYADLFGDTSVTFDSLLLFLFLGLLAGLVVLVARSVGLTAMGAGLVPVALGYIVAHYLTYLLVEGQRIVIAVSDPLQQGWDLFGTARWDIQDAWLPTTLVWTVQVSAVVIGHVVGAWLGHGAIRRSRADGARVRGWPLAALMVGMTALALWSLGQNLVFVSEAVEVPTALVLGSGR